MDRLGQRIGNEDMCHPAQHRPPQRFGGACDITHDRKVGDIKSGDLSLTAVIPPHGIGVHLTAGIGDQLRTDRGQFA